MKKVFLLSLFFCGTSLISKASSIASVDKTEVANINSGINAVLVKPDAYHTGVIPPYGNVPALLYTWDDEVDGDELAAYSAVVDYGMWYAGSH